MDSRMRNEYMPEVVSPPGHTLQDILSERQLTQADLAERTGRTKKMINEIVKGKAPITPETALQFEKVLGVSATFWNNREMAYRANLARRKEETRLREQLDWVKEVPYREMARWGWVPETSDRVERVRALLSFFAVASRDQWKDVIICPQATFRRSAKLQTDPGALSAWLRQGEIEAGRLECAAYDRQGFVRALAWARSLTLEEPEVFKTALNTNFARCGVAVVFIPELRGLPVWGATKWLSPTRALIQLSLRYKTDDHLWFTLFHEAGHILLHNKREVFVEGEGASNAEESEANRFAADFLIPPRAFQELRASKYFTEQAVTLFAREHGISPGIVVGRLQHEGVLPLTHLNGLKRRFHWVE